MAPVRRSRMSMNVTLSGFDIEEQLREMKRYEQEMKDRMIAQNIQSQENQRLRPLAPAVDTGRNGIFHSAPQVQAPLVFFDINPLPDLPPPPSPILAGAPRIQSRSNEAPSAQRAPSVTIVRTTGPTRQLRRSSRQFGPSGSSRNSEMTARRAERASSNRQQRRRDTSDEGSDDDVVEVYPATINTTNGSRSSSSSNSSNSSIRSSASNISSSMSASSISSNGPNITISSVSTVSSNASIPNRQAFIGNDANMYNREYAPIDNQPSTSGVLPAARVRSGSPNPTWGDCTMCFEIPIRPQGCTRCYQIIGCKTCVENWHSASQNPSCPLCRRKWNRKPDVLGMATIDSRRRTEANRRAQLRMRTQVLADN